LKGGNISLIEPDTIKQFFSSQKKIETVDLEFNNMDIKSLKAVLDGYSIAIERFKK